MKQLPKEFTFICDEHSREQLEKLGVKLNGWAVDAIGEQYAVIRNGVCSYRSGLTLISLSDYIDQPENKPTNATEQKWQPLTRGGYEYVIYEEFEGNLFGRVKPNSSEDWYAVTWNINGSLWGASPIDAWDLLPYDPHAPRKAEVKSEIERL